MKTKLKKFLTREYITKAIVSAGLLALLLLSFLFADKLEDGDKILISEGCTHHRQCEDIGTVKIPGWLTKHTGKKLDFTFTSGGEFPTDLSPY